MSKIINISFLLSTLLLISISLKSQIYRDSTDCSDQLNLAWVKTAGANDVDAVNDIVVDDAGNIYITGYFSFDMDFQGTVVSSNGFKDYYLAKLDTDGNLIWIKTGGGPQDDEATGIALDDSGNVYITGNFGGESTFGTDVTTSQGGKDIFLIKYDNLGNYQWGEFMGGYEDDISGDICVDNNNYIILTGTFYFAIYIPGLGSHVGQGADDFFIAKYNSSGDFQWVTDDGSTLDDSGHKITCDIANNYYVTGEFSGTIDFGPIDLTASGTNDVFLAKYTSNGSFDWAVQVGTGGDNDKAGDVACNNDSKVYLAFKKDQVGDQAQINIYNNTGIFNNSIVFGGSGTVQPYGLTVDNSGASYVSGTYSGTPDFGDGNVVTVGGSDYFVAKYKSDGTFGFKDVAGSVFLDCASALALDNSSNLYVGGYCNNGIYFGGTPYTAVGKEDNLIVKYDSYFAFEQIEISSIDCDPNNMCVDIEIAGGLPPFDYYWEDGETTEDVCGYSEGDYQIIVTDENDCYIETTVSITAPTAAAVDLASTYNMCYYDTISLTAGGDYVDFDWSTGTDITQSIDVSAPGVYSVTVTDVNSCTTSASTTVNQGADVNLLVSDTVYNCTDEDITFSVPGFTSYMWISGSQGPSYTTNEDGLHWLWAFDGACYFFDTVRIINYPKPIIDLGGDFIVCEGDSVQLEVIGDEFVSYLWQDNSTESYFWASESGSISVMATDTNGCVTTDALAVTAVEAEQIELGEDATYCTLFDIILDPQAQSEDNVYLWSTGETTETISVNTTDQYWVQVTNSGGCISSDTITLTIYPQPIVDLGGDISFCEGNSDTIRVIGDYMSYEWNTGEITDWLYVDASGLFSVTATDINGCFDSDTIIVFESILAEPFLGYDTTLCDDEIYRLEPFGDYYRYSWNNGSSSSYINVSEPGTYSLTVTDQVGCTSSSGLSIDYTTGPTILNIDSGGGQIIVGVTGGTTPYQFSYDGDTWQTDYYFNSLESGYYTIYVMDSNYCMTSIDTYLDESIDVPSFFTPNGDGYNDLWVISGLYQFPNARVEVFDRYGKKLYEFTGNELGWSGIYAGRPLPSDTYWYSIKLSEDRRALTGHVTIKR